MGLLYQVSLAFGALDEGPAGAGTFPAPAAPDRVCRQSSIVYSPVMATKQISHVFDCDVDTFWKKFFLDEEFNRQLFIDRLGFSRWEVIRTEPLEDGIKRVVEAAPSTKDIPGPLKKVLQNGLGYREEGVWSRSKSLYTLRVTPASLPDQIEITGEMRVTPEGQGCRRTYDAFVNARLFMVGGLLEGRLLSDVAKSYDEAAAFSREWLSQGK